MDRTGANFLRVVGQVRNKLGANAVPIQIPIGAEENFEGVVDLIKMKGIYWNQANQGVTFEERDIPADLVEICNQYRDQMVEAAAEASDEFMNKYLETGTPVQKKNS